MEEKRTRFLKSSESDIRKGSKCCSIYNTLIEGLFNDKPLSGLLVCRLIMSLTEGFYS